MKLPHLVCAALLTSTIAAGAYQLGRREASVSFRRSSFASASVASASSLVAAAPGSSEHLPPLARAEAALAAALAAGHWHPNREWESLIQALSPSDLRRLVPTVDAVSRRFVRDPLLAALASRWGESDPASAMAWAETLPETKRRQQATAAIARGWAHANPDTLVAWLRAQPAGPTRISVTNAALGSLAHSRPVAALDLVEREPEPGHLQQHGSTIFRTWAASDPQAAADHARRVRPASLRAAALHAVIESWSDQDPVEALAFARTLPRETRPGSGSDMFVVGSGCWNSDVDIIECVEGPSVFAGDFTGGALGRLAQKDPAAALAAVHDLPSGRDRERALRDIALLLLDHDPGMASAFAGGLQPGPTQARLLQQIAVRYATTDPAGALTSARGLPESVAKTAALHTIAFHLATTEPTQAIALVQSLPDSARRTQNLAGIASTWANKDPAAAIAWTRSLPDTPERSALLEAMTGPWARFDPSAAVAFVLDQPKSRQRSLLQNLGTQLGNQDSRAVLDLLPSIPDSESRNMVLRSAIDVFAYRSPADAATLIARSSTPIPGHVVGQVAQQFAASDPATAIQWVATLPPTDARHQALDSIAQSWTSTDPQATAQWISSLPLGPGRDAATRGYVEALAPSVPDLAAPMALTISDPARRNAALERIAQSWLALNRPAASAWLATTPLAPDIRQRLLNR